MTFRLSATAMLVALLGIAPAAPLLVTPAMAGESDIGAFDPDKDGTIDLAEAQRAATKTFDKLDSSQDQDLDAKELGSRLSEAELKGANPDNDGVLGRSEYLNLVVDRFKAADPDNDNTIDAKELESPAGKALLQLMR